MAEQQWTSTGISKLFHLNEKVKSRQTLFNAEEKGEIPKAQRVNRGSTKVRMWKTQQLPEIGKRYGFLKRPAQQQVISVYTSKGGVLKSTLAHNVGRCLALNGIKVLIVGLDIQLSITETITPAIELDSLEDYNDEVFGLYHFLYHDKPLIDVISKTDLPTLDYIPETPELNAVEKQLRHESRREYVIKDKLMPYLSAYDVVIFDNSPSWSCLIENSLTVSQHVISPIGCEINSYRALKQHFEFVTSFKKTMRLNWESFTLVPTLLEKTKLSQQIYGAYLTEYPKDIIAIPIRRSVKGHEAGLLGISVMEHDIQSSLAQDYYELLLELWARVNNTEEKIMITEKAKEQNFAMEA